MTAPIPLSGRQPKAVRSALHVLEEIVSAGPGVTAKEISESLAMPQATTYRILNLLVAEEYLVRLPDLSGFALGRRAARLALPAATTLTTAARAVVDHMRGQTRWGVHVASYAAEQISLVDPDPDHPAPDAGALARFPYAFALGRLLLAEQADWRALVRDVRPFTARTVTSEPELDRTLKAVARDGLARQCGEFREDRGCIAVPIRGPRDGRLVAGIALAGPTARIAEPNEEIIAVLRDHAARLAPLLA
ncbi:helix-turn-helix domain-containing protein [Pseudonocardia sp. RS11V-5]|uniref:IclR family transcriptional regulator n=1 Tax=Pseudonocardia terrae TaxID=2905831 RepID=UPI001E453B0A|nr:IclR family transcriptional regulator C-terminal domain-containing protein [Pseudonocardia terrae]MCE3554421.1 helix-turn-helix domain-containing protein [Pseudonocardia terrae]